MRAACCRFMDVGLAAAHNGRAGYPYRHAGFVDFAWGDDKRFHIRLRGTSPKIRSSVGQQLVVPGIGHAGKQAL